MSLYNLPKFTNGYEYLEEGDGKEIMIIIPHLDIQKQTDLSKEGY